MEDVALLQHPSTESPGLPDTFFVGFACCLWICSEDSTMERCSVKIIPYFPSDWLVSIS